MGSLIIKLGGGYVGIYWHSAWNTLNVQLIFIMSSDGSVTRSHIDSGLSEEAQMGYHEGQWDADPQGAQL